MRSCGREWTPTASRCCKRRTTAAWRRRTGTLAPRRRSPTDQAPGPRAVRSRIAGLPGRCEERRANLLNRALADADVLLPIGCVRRRGPYGFRGVHGAIFPAYSDQRTQLRFRAADALGSAADRKGLVQEVANVGWLLGVSFTIQVVPGPGATVYAPCRRRASDAVGRRVRELYEAAWRFTVPRRAAWCWRRSRAARPSRPGTMSAGP